jgi:hypothetical protein
MMREGGKSAEQVVGPPHPFIDLRVDGNAIRLQASLRFKVVRTVPPRSCGRRGGPLMASETAAVLAAGRRFNGVEQGAADTVAIKST